MTRLKSFIFLIISLYYSLRYRRVNLEKGVHIYPGTSLAFLYCKKTGKIKIGKDAIIGSLDKTYRMGWYHPTRLSIMGSDACIVIGDGTFLNGVNICAKKSISIGKKCHLASGVQIVDYNGHELYRWDRWERDEANPISIGNNVWIGLNALILKGSEIGDNSVVAAGSVVKGVFPPFSLIGGNPAKLIKILDENNFS